MRKSSSKSKKNKKVERSIDKKDVEKNINTSSSSSPQPLNNETNVVPSHESMEKLRDAKQAPNKSEQQQTSTEATIQPNESEPQQKSTEVTGMQPNESDPQQKSTEVTSMQQNESELQQTSTERKVSDEKVRTETAISSLETSLENVAESLQYFSSSLRSLYSDLDVGKSTEATRDFTAIRDKTRDYANEHLELIIPPATDLISSIKEFFEFNYEAWPSYEKWKKQLSSILKNLEKRKCCAVTLKEKLANLIVPLNQLKDEAKIAITKLIKEDESEKTLSSSPSCFSFLFSRRSPSIAALEVETMAKSKTQEDAAREVMEMIIPSLSTFFNGLLDATKFFQTMEAELQSLERMDDAVKENHYKTMKDNVRKIIQCCYDFNAALPNVRSDFKAIVYTQSHSFDRETQPQGLKQIEEPKADKECTEGLNTPLLNTKGK